MVYQGSKARILHWMLPFIQKCIDDREIRHYVEPFVGGANVIDHVKCLHRTGSDVNGELISLLSYMESHPELEGFPAHCSFEHYAEVREARKKGIMSQPYKEWYMAGIGYFASYGGRYFDGGYGRDRTGKRDMYAEGLAYARKQAPLLKGITFKMSHYSTLSFLKDKDSDEACFVYCDPPYRGVKSYDAQKFDYEEFYAWCEDVGKRHFLLISEYEMPSDRFIPIAEHCHWSKQRSDRGSVSVREKLYTPRMGLYNIWFDYSTWQRLFKED